jgi:hypothetical protein
MQTPPLDPDIADIAPSGTALTSYDNEHLVTYLRLLDAHAEGADWREVARVVLHLDPEHECDRARKDVRQPFIARQMDDGARLSSPAPWWRVGLKRRCQVATAHSVGCVFHAAALSSLSAPRATILIASSGNGRCSVFASSHGAHPVARESLPSPNILV